MAQSLSQLYVHIVFHIKTTSPIILQETNGELYAYIGGVINNLECRPIKIGGYSDHLHILCTLSKNISLAKLVEEIKRNSSRWIKTKSPHYRNFAWQNGYGGFSVSPIHCDNLKHYIEHQFEHHSNIKFEDEYAQLLRKYDVEYNPKYIFTD